MARAKGWRNRFYLSWICLLGVLYLVFGNVLESRYNPNKDLNSRQQAGEPVVLTRNKQGHYIAPGLINQQPVIFTGYRCHQCQRSGIRG
ncbi:hypothetical protein [Aliamphritea spongicola]|nr:hypothetical protein [Aliamphritea spongicola]